MSGLEWVSVIGTSVASAAAISSGIYALFQRHWSKEAKRRDEYLDLKKRMENILTLTIQYPYLEDKSITETWKDNMHSLDEKHMRYNQFCCVLYNFLSDLYEFYGGDSAQIQKFVDIKTWVRVHRQIWENPLDPNEIPDGYTPEFRSYINSYLH